MPASTSFSKPTRLGIVLDISHISQPGFWAVLEASNASIVVSHASARELHDHPRNLTDRQVKAVAAQGGVVGVSFVAEHLSASRPTVETIADHIEHMVQLVGARHVGIGPDFVSYLYKRSGFPLSGRAATTRWGWRMRPNSPTSLECYCREAFLSRTWTRCWAGALYV